MDHRTGGEQRRLNRVPVRVVVSDGARSAVIGKTRDLSLEGVFVVTDRPFDRSAVVPLALKLDPNKPEVRVEAEVVRVTGDGMGLRFLHPDRATLKALRNFVNELTSIGGARRSVEELLAPDRSVQPLEDPATIAKVLEDTQSAAVTLSLIPAAREVLDRAQITSVSPETLTLRAVDPSLLEVGEEVFALVTHDFLSYSFTARVEAVDGHRIDLTVPERLHYSERRDRERRPTSPRTRIRWPAPWAPGSFVEYPVRDISPDGLSFRIDGAACQLTPGASLEDAVLVDERGAETPLGPAEVRHITLVEGDAGPWLRVGVALGAARAKATHETVTLRERDKGGRLRRLGRRVGKISTAFSYLLHLQRKKLGAIEDAIAARKVRIRRGPFELVGLLDRTFDDGERVRCPLVIVIPGFGGRKEQMSLLAGTLVEGFRRNHGDLAVLRIDGSNNLGESEKDPGCTTEGMHTLHYTISGTISDVLACLDWARRNDYVDPSHIILTSVSMGSIAVRHVLTRDDTADVGMWVCYMGATDVRDSVKHVSGYHLDIFDRDPSEPLGIASLAGCLTDGDRFVEDVTKLNIGRLADAKREMAQIKADVLWFMGRHDAFMDPRRVEELMAVRAPGRREIIEVDSGHLPTSGEEAIKQFTLITRRVWQHVHRAPMPADFHPSLGRLAANAKLEWERVRHDRARLDRASWWRDYLLDSGALGFDVLEHAPAYTDFMELQARLADPEGKDVLELGAGTGNLSHRLAAHRPRRLVVSEYLAEPLDRIRAKLRDAPVDAQVLQIDADGSPLVAMRRWIAGDLPSAKQLAERVPGVPRDVLERLTARHDDELHAALRGRALDPAALASSRRLSAEATRLLHDLHLLARAARGLVAPQEAGAALQLLPKSAVAAPHGLPFPDASFDVVAVSLVLSYLDHPDDTLWEAHRVLRPGGRLVVSSMRRDTDSSKLYLELVERLSRLPEDQLPAGLTREEVVGSVHTYAGAAAELLRLEEEGFFTFYDPEQLVELVTRRGFERPEVNAGWGDPSQAIVVTCSKI